jgi:hypothetical protein
MSERAGDENECKEIAEDTIAKCNEDYGKVLASSLAVVASYQ